MSFSFENKSENELIQLITTAFYNCSLPDPAKRKHGEQTLINSSLNPSYPLILIQLILTQNKFDISLIRFNCLAKVFNKILLFSY